MSKKGTKSPKSEVSTYEIGDTVLGKVRGYPPWPARVVDPESVPAKVSSERPVNKKSLHYCVQFFPTGDFAWLPPKDISKLKPHEIQSYISDPVKRSGELLEGYKIARDPTQWAQEREAAAAATAAEEDDDDDAGGDEEDELAAEDGDQRVPMKKRKAPTASASASTTKKRKRDRDSESTPATKPARGSATTKTKGTGKQRKSKAAVESEDEGAQGTNEGRSKQTPTSTPAAKKAKTSASAAAGKDENVDDDELAKDPEATKVREWRHRLQKVFLSSKVVAPKPEEMPDMNELFNQIETYDKINIAYLSFSKIGKVMRHITALSDEKVPLDSRFHFRDRAKILVEQWQHIINAGKDGSSTSNNNVASSNTNAKGNRSRETTTTNGRGHGPGHGQSKSPGGENVNVNGIADAINSSIAGSAMGMEVDAEGVAAGAGMNGHGHGQSNGHGRDDSMEDADADPVGNQSILPDITMSEIGVDQ
jgi:hypothetical protein